MAIGRHAFLIFLLTIADAQSQFFYGIPDQQQVEKLYGEFQEQPPLIDPDLLVEEQQVEKDDGSTSPNELYSPVNIGQATGVVVNNKGNLVILHRADRVWDQFSFNDKTNVFNKTLEAIKNATISVLDPSTGRLIGEFGQNQFYMPHGLSTDSEGNYWATDVARHQVIKFDSNFKPLLVLGEKMVPGNDEKHFCKPTDVAVAKTGEIFVADGYCNSRIIKFSADGKFVTSFGGPNTDPTKPKNGEFFVPHSLTLIENLNLLCVADRENQRIQCFTAGLSPKDAHQRAINPFGSFVTKAQNIGRIMAIREKENYLVGVTDMDDGNDYQIFIMDINSGRVNTFAKGIKNAHAIALSDDGEIYVAQLDPTQVIKFSVPQQLQFDDFEDQIDAAK